MMKKLYLLSILCIINTMQADQLSEAIRLSDVETVSLLLSEQKPTALQLVKYLDIAEQIINTRRSMPGLGYISCKDRSKYWDPYGRILLASTGGFLASGILMVHDEKHGVPSNRSAWLMLLSCIGLFGSAAAKGNLDHQINVCLHNNALKVKEMLYDCSTTANSGLYESEIEKQKMKEFK